LKKLLKKCKFEEKNTLKNLKLWKLNIKETKLFWKNQILKQHFKKLLEKSKFEETIWKNQEERNIINTIHTPSKFQLNPIYLQVVKGKLFSKKGCILFKWAGLLNLQNIKIFIKIMSIKGVRGLIIFKLKYLLWRRKMLKI